MVNLVNMPASRELMEKYQNRHLRQIEHAAKQCKAQQSNAKPSNSKQSTAQQSKARSKAKQSKAKQSTSKQSKAKQSKANQSQAKRSKAKQFKAMQSKAKWRKAKQDRIRWGKMSDFVIIIIVVRVCQVSYWLTAWLKCPLGVIIMIIVWLVLVLIYIYRSSVSHFKSRLHHFAAATKWWTATLFC